MKGDNGGTMDGKLTYTDIRDNIPEGSMNKQMEEGWEIGFNTEWRWRFLKFENERHVIEMSYLKKGNKNRVFCDKYGNWVNNVEVNNGYDSYVVEVYYLYTKN